MPSKFVNIPRAAINRIGDVVRRYEFGNMVTVNLETKEDRLVLNLTGFGLIDYANDGNMNHDPFVGKYYYLEFDLTDLKQMNNADYFSSAQVTESVGMIMIDYKTMSPPALEITYWYQTKANDRY